MNRRLLTIDLALKAALVLLLLHAVVFPDLPQYQGKGIGWRLLLYPISSILVPLGWFVARLTRAGYPYLIDIFVGLPFLIDTAGNAANFYDRIDWWDDAMHFVTWVPWVLAFGLAVRRRPNLRRFDVAAITIGFGAATHIVWELLEYVAFIRDNPNEYQSAYRDTMGDLTMSLLGSITGGVLVATALWGFSGAAVSGAGRQSGSPQPR
ncbi:MAG: hypothetical protein E6G39_16335 [Actinobacteria bacterium]|nr:MAG: hypothetical protein E6G39_16335 [Actinomycetota bacterium]